jgi:hypothetical protein
MKAAPLPIAAAIALEMIGPIPGNVIKWRQGSLFLEMLSISVDAFVEITPVLNQVFENTDHPRGEHIGPLAENIGQGVAQPMQPLTDGNAVLEKK